MIPERRIVIDDRAAVKSRIAGMRSIHGKTPGVKFTHKRRAANNSPSRTCNNRKRNRSTCSGAIRAAARIPDSTAKDLRSDLPDAGDPAEVQRFALQPVPAHRGPGLPPTSRCVPRLDGYNTSRCKGKAWEKAIMDWLAARDGGLERQEEHCESPQATN